MKHKRLILAASAVVLLTLILFAGFFLGRRSSVDHSISLSGGISRLEYYVSGDHLPSLVDIEVGMTLEEVEKMIPGIGKMPWSHQERIIYSCRDQVALILLAPASEEIIEAYAVFSSDRTPLKVDLSSGHSVYHQMVSADLAKADFRNQTLFELMDQYSFQHSNRASLGHMQHILLDDGRVMTLNGMTCAKCESYNAFNQDYRIYYPWYRDAQNRPVNADTYMYKVSVWDILQFKPGMSWSEIQSETIFEEPTETVDQRNSDYFLRWLQEHVPEGMTRQEVDRWIEDFRAGSEQE